jgi:hypothetical protein
VIHPRHSTVVAAKMTLGLGFGGLWLEWFRK